MFHPVQCARSASAVLIGGPCNAKAFADAGFTTEEQLWSMTKEQAASVVSDGGTKRKVLAAIKRGPRKEVAGSPAKKRKKSSSITGQDHPAPKKPPRQHHGHHFVERALLHAFVCGWVGGWVRAFGCVGGCVCVCVCLCLCGCFDADSLRLAVMTTSDDLVAHAIQTIAGKVGIEWVRDIICLRTGVHDTAAAGSPCP